MFNSKARKIAYLGIMSALIFVLLLAETGLGSILPISPCYLSLPVAITLCVYGDYKNMFAGGTVFGVCSFILAVIFPKFAAFLNPLISVLPRFFIGLAAYGFYILMKKCIKRDYICLGLAGVAGVLANTVLTLTMLLIFGKTTMETILTVIISVNTSVELFCGAVIVPVLTKAVRKFILQ